MTRPGGPSLSGIIASKDAGPDSSSGLGAVSLRRLWPAVPALCALAYPSLLKLLSAGLVLVHGSDSVASAAREIEIFFPGLASS